MSHRPALVLNVNDHDASRYVISRILRSAGFEVLESSTGEEALRLAGEQQPDLVILDVKLPDVSGLEVCRRLKADPRTVGMAVLHLSARYIRPENRVEGLESGADAYLTQPVGAPELLATVRALLRMRQAEESAREAALEWQVIFDSLRDGVCLLDLQGRVVRANQAFWKLLGCSEEQVRGRPFSQLIREAAASEAALPESCGGAPDCREEAEVCLGERWYRVAANPVAQAQGATSGAVRVLTDITARRELAALAEADRQKDEFLAMLAHELRNPLAAIINALYLAESTWQEAQAPSALEVVARQSRHMRRLVEDLLDMSRLNRGHIALRREPVDLRQVVQHGAQARRRLIEERGLSLEVRLPASGDLWLEGDATRLEQVLTNLLDNSTKFTVPGGHIVVEVERDAEGAQAVLRVRDTGIGMSQELMERAFNPFVQGEQQLDRARGGLGIGLTLVRRLVEMHGGTVSVHSEGAGRGSEFTVRLPLCAPPSVAEQRAQAPASHAGHRRRVLLVEDNKDTREVMRQLLEMWGHQVEEAADGYEAVERFQEVRPEVALVDLGLPGMDGLQVARRIRACEGGESVFLMALTGYSGSYRSQAMEAGFDVHLVKPVGPEELERLLEELPARHASEPPPAH